MKKNKEKDIKIVGDGETHHLVSIEDIEELRKKVTVSVDTIGVNLVKSQATKLVAKNAVLKGFRQGRAPLSMVEKFCGPQIDLATKSILTKQAYVVACSENELHPHGEPEFDEAEINNGTFKCVFTVNILPHIEPRGYVGLNLKKPNEPRQQLVEHHLADLKRIHSTDVQCDEVAVNRVAIVDFRLIVGKEEISKGDKHPFIILAGATPPFGENLVGLKVGDNKIEKIVLPKEFKEYADKEADVHITIDSVIQKVPPTDEELVERMEVGSYEELIKQLEQKVEVLAKQKEAQALEEQAVDRLIELHKFSVPKEWVADEARFMEGQLGLKEIDEETRKTINALAERNVKRSFILDAIYNEEQASIQISPEELNNTICEEAKRMGVSSMVLKKDLLEKNMMDSLVASIKHRKVMNLILMNAVFEQEEQVVEEEIDIPENPFE